MSSSRPLVAASAASPSSASADYRDAITLLSQQLGRAAALEKEGLDGPYVSEAGLLETSHAPTVQQLRTMTSVPSGMYRGPTVKSGRRRKKKSATEKHVPVSGERAPWLPRPLINHEIVVHEALASLPLITTSSTVPVFGALWFEVNQLANVAGYSTVFDEYCIFEIEVLITPNLTETSSATVLGSYTSAIDLDDSNVPTNLNELASYESSVTTQSNVGHYHRWSPQFSIAAYSGAFTSYAAGQGWVDIASPSVCHYGVKVGSDVGVVQNLTYRTRMKVGFRRVR